MKVVILQPSYIPWRGYFDQIRCADLFVFYDDVQYDKRSWRNRNQIKTPRGKQWLTIPVFSRGAQTANIPINQIRITWDKPWNREHLKALQHSYARAPYFDRYVHLLEEIYQQHDEYLADFTITTSISLARALGFTSTRFMRSSEIPGIVGQKTDRVINILKYVGATHYFCGPSASVYMEPEKFAEAGISFEYMKYDYPEYPQMYPPYDPFVSIFDLMFMIGDGAGDCFIRQESEEEHERG